MAEMDDWPGPYPYELKSDKKEKEPEALKTALGTTSGSSMAKNSDRDYPTLSSLVKNSSSSWDLPETQNSENQNGDQGSLIEESSKLTTQALWNANRNERLKKHRLGGVERLDEWVGLKKTQWETRWPELMNAKALSLWLKQSILDVFHEQGVAHLPFETPEHEVLIWANEHADLWIQKRLDYLSSQWPMSFDLSGKKELDALALSHVMVDKQAYLSSSRKERLSSIKDSKKMSAEEYTRLSLNAISKQKTEPAFETRFKEVIIHEEDQPVWLMALKRVHEIHTQLKGVPGLDLSTENASTSNAIPHDVSMAVSTVGHFDAGPLKKQEPEADTENQMSPVKGRPDIHQVRQFASHHLGLAEPAYTSFMRDPASKRIPMPSIGGLYGFSDGDLSWAEIRISEHPQLAAKACQEEGLAVPKSDEKEVYRLYSLQNKKGERFAVVLMKKYEDENRGYKVVKIKPHREELREWCHFAVVHLMEKVIPFSSKLEQWTSYQGLLPSSKSHIELGRGEEFRGYAFLPGIGLTTYLGGLSDSHKETIKKNLFKWDQSLVKEDLPVPQQVDLQKAKEETFAGLIEVGEWDFLYSLYGNLESQFKVENHSVALAESCRFEFESERLAKEAQANKGWLGRGAQWLSILGKNAKGSESSFKSYNQKQYIRMRSIHIKDWLVIHSQRSHRRGVSKNASSEILASFKKINELCEELILFPLKEHPETSAASAAKNSDSVFISKMQELKEVKNPYGRSLLALEATRDQDRKLYKPDGRNELSLALASKLKETFEQQIRYNHIPFLKEFCLWKCETQRDLTLNVLDGLLKSGFEYATTELRRKNRPLISAMLWQAWHYQPDKIHTAQSLYQETTHRNKKKNTNDSTANTSLIAPISAPGFEKILSLSLTTDQEIAKEYQGWLALWACEQQVNVQMSLNEENKNLVHKVAKSGHAAQWGLLSRLMPAKAIQELWANANTSNMSAESFQLLSQKSNPWGARAGFLTQSIQNDEWDLIKATHKSLTSYHKTAEGLQSETPAMGQISFHLHPAIKKAIEKQWLSSKGSRYEQQEVYLAFWFKNAVPNLSAWTQHWMDATHKGNNAIKEMILNHWPKLSMNDPEQLKDWLSEHAIAVQMSTNGNKMLNPLIKKVLESASEVHRSPEALAALKAELSSWTLKDQAKTKKHTAAIVLLSKQVGEWIEKGPKAWSDKTPKAETWPWPESQQAETAPSITSSKMEGLRSRERQRLSKEEVAALKMKSQKQFKFYTK